MKIVYCLDSIRYLGGIQSVTIAKANALAELEGYEVCVAVTDNRRGVRVDTLSDKVKLIDLDVNYYADDWQSVWKSLRVFVCKRRLHRRRLAVALRRLRPDIVISVGQSEKYFLPKISRHSHTVREFHYAKTYRLPLAHTLFGKICAVLGNVRDNCLSLRRYDAIAVLTHEDYERNWRGWKNVAVIPNPLTHRSPVTATLDAKKVVAVGRLEYAKNFSSLIRVFRLVVNRHPDWTLDIYGEGGQRTALQAQIDALHLEHHVKLKGFTGHVQQAMLEGSILALTSVYEGFAMVLTEAMDCGLPVVSYATPCGPKDIITDGTDGYLVPMNDEALMAERICSLIEDPAQRKAMGRAAKAKVEEYGMERVMAMWKNLFEKLIKQQRR